MLVFAFFPSLRRQLTVLAPILRALKAVSTVFLMPDSLPMMWLLEDI